MNLNNRERFHYKVQLQHESGEITQVDYAVYWSPEKTEPSFVAESCAAEHSSGKRGKFAGLTAVLIEA